MTNKERRIAAVIGNPIAHSMSPLIHNAGIKKLELNYDYLAFKVENVKESIIKLKKENFVGYSVTIPHKIEVMKYLDEIDPNAKKIGAVNTIVNKNGKLIGYNTDCDGAINPLKEITKLNGKNIYLIGAGGAARAIVCGLTQERANVTIFNRTIEHAQKLAKEFNCKAKELTEFDSNCEIIINTTPVGMWPNINEMPIDATVLKKEMIVFDTVYNPLETKLIKSAKNKGCTTILGVEMFLNQAYAQFELFFHASPPKEHMREVLLNELKKRQKEQNTKN